VGGGGSTAHTLQVPERPLQESLLHFYGKRTVPASQYDDLLMQHLEICVSVKRQRPTHLTGSVLLNDPQIIREREYACQKSAMVIAP